MNDEEFPYGIGAVYNGEAVIDENLVVETIPTDTYAVIKCVGLMPEAFAKTYKQMYTEFFPASGYQPCKWIEFETYPSSCYQYFASTCTCSSN